MPLYSNKGSFSRTFRMGCMSETTLYNPQTRCPCTSGEVYGACCGRYLDEFAASGTLGAPTPLALMRSRFTAFALHDAPYLLASWHSHTRPAELDTDKTLRWYRRIFWALRAVPSMRRARSSSWRTTARFPARPPKNA